MSTHRPVPAAPRGFAGLAATLFLLVLAPAGLLPVGGELEAQSPRVSVVHGAEIRVLTSGGAPLEGELLAVARDRLWLLSRDADLVTAGQDEILRVERRRHDLGPRRLGTWIGVGAGVTSAAMIFACASVDDSGSCPAFTFLWAGSWALVGGISWVLMRPTQRVGPMFLEELQPWARFPQGIPADYTPAPGRQP